MASVLKTNLIEKAMAELSELKRLADDIEKVTGVKVVITITRVAGDELNGPIKLPGISGIMKPGQEINLDDVFIKKG
jgi:hypothetical protein